ncbi:MAG TPA: HAD family hydrolase, partial [Polyangiales bacterium]|nr:HAD family hydrolase [Polyangiales bacterium]
MSRAYDALVLDMDGTLLDDADQISPRTAAAIQRAREKGVKVMLATGRSHQGVRAIATQLGLDIPSIVFNGAGVYDLREDRLLSCYTLPESLVTALIAHARVHALEPVVACAEAQYARMAKPDEQSLLKGFVHLEQRPESELPRRDVLRVTLFSQHHRESIVLLEEVQRVLADYPAYCTHFALAALPGFRSSHAQVVDVQPDCAGKAEALGLLADRFGIPPERV